MTVITELNEFTWDMVRALPQLNYSIENEEEVKVVCKNNLEGLYRQFTPNVNSVKLFNPYNDNTTYENSRPEFTKKRWSPPKIKDKWVGYMSFDKPTIVVQNKYTLEWGGGPYNYFNEDFLDKFFTTFKNDYQIIYIRPYNSRKDYYTDENKMLDFKDYELINEKHPEVYTIKDMMNEHPNLDFNSCQFALHATSERHISPSGGNACLSAYFGGDLLIFDTYNGMGKLRGIWKDDSWLKDLGGSKIYGFTNREDLINNAMKLWK